MERSAMRRAVPWILAVVHATLFISMLAPKPFEPYPGPKKEGELSFSGWHTSTSIMVAGRDLHQDQIGKALFLSDAPVLALIVLAAMPFDNVWSPLLASYVLGAAWLIGGSLWWFAIGRLVTRRGAKARAHRNAG
jgi:hypothetical protein